MADKNKPGRGVGPAPGKGKKSSASSVPLAVEVDNIPAELRTLSQWVTWRIDASDNKPTKVPYDARTGRRAKSNDPSTWCDFGAAVAAYRTGRYAGIGFMLGEGDGLAGVDLDHVLDPDTGEIEEWAIEVIERFGGSYVERSPSGTGFRIFCRGKPQRSGKGTPQKRVEVYAHPSHRYLTVTGRWWPDSATTVTDQQAALDWLHDRFFAAADKPASPPPAPTGPADLDDDAVVQKIISSKQGQKFLDLWAGNPGSDASAADLSLCSILAFWVDRDPVRIDRLFRRSGLYRNPGRAQKWDRKHYADGRTYGQATVDRAISSTTETYRPPAAEKTARKQRPSKSPTSAATPPSPKAPLKNGRAQRPQPQPDGRPVIELREGEQRRICDASEAALLTRNPYAVFHRGGQVVRMARLDRDEGDQDDPVRRKKGTPTLLPAGVKWLAAEFEQAAVYKKYDARTDGLVVKNCPERVPALYLDSAGHWRCKPLRGLVEHPYILPDGTVVATAGYDDLAGYFLDAGACLPAIPARPSRTAAESSLEVLVDLLGEFPFRSDTDLSVALAALLTPYVRPGIPVSPLFAFDAAAQGSGKTALAEVPSMVATGRTPTTVSFAPDPAEMEKRLVGLFMSGDTHVVLDNVTCPVDGDFLAQCVSRREVAGRLLGSNAKWQGEPMACISITGNNLQIVGDMPRRTLRCRLDAQMEHPHLRRFRRDLESHVRAHRPELIAAVMTVLRAYHAAGRPDVGDIPPFAGYEPWSRMVRHPIVWLGLPDPLGSQIEVLGRDPALQKVGAILLNWHAMLGGKKELLATVVSATKNVLMDDPVGDHKDALREIFLEVAGEKNEISVKRLGNYLRWHVDHPVGGYVLRQPGEDKHTGLMFWAVERAGSAGSCGVTSTLRGKSVRNNTPRETQFGDTFGERAETDPARPRRPRNDPPVVGGKI